MAIKYLILHESPKEASTVNKFLPKEYYAMSTWGHFMETSSKELDIDKTKWELNWKLSWDKNKKEQLNKIWAKIKEVLSNWWKVILATDPDREWAVIASEIISYFKLKKWQYAVHPKVTDLNSKPYMDWLNKTLDDIDWDLVESGIARQILDKLVWFELTENLWAWGKWYKPFLEDTINEINNKRETFEQKNKSIIENNKNVKEIVEKFKKLNFDDLHEFKNRLGTSFWRVQSSVLCLLVEKELEKFDKELERKINIFAKDWKTLQWEFSKNSELETNTEEMQKIYNNLDELIKTKEVKVQILDVKSEIKEVNPPIPMDTQMAQTSINSMFWYSIKEIMKILQSTYEAWHTTYMRTDTNNVPDSYKEHLQETLKINWNLEFINRKYKNSSIWDKEAQGWHEWILPTKPFDLKNLPKCANDKEDKVLAYIIKRSTAAFMKPAKIEYFNYFIHIEDLSWNKYFFVLKDPNINEKWFLEIIEYYLDKYEQKVFYKKWEEITIKEFILNEKNIKLSGWYTEWNLVKELKKIWIWRPSTWETIISTLKDKEYITLSKSKIEITPKGYFVRKIIVKDNNFNHFPSANYTSQMENELDEIANWKMNRITLLEKVNKEIQEINWKEKPIFVKWPKKEFNKDWTIEPKEHCWKCPSCKKGFIEKKEVNWKTVWSCTNWMNKCKFTIWESAAQHKFTDEEVKEIIKNGWKSQLIENFVSKAWNNFSAYYVFEKWKWFTFEFPPRK